jgi:hypothetical protein
MSRSSTLLPPPEGPGCASGAPPLPAGLTDTFINRHVDTGELRLHSVVRGDGPALPTTGGGAGRHGAADMSADNRARR